MRIAIVLALVLAAMPLSAEECGTPYETGNPGEVKMDVNFGGTIRTSRVALIEGPVQVDLGNCADADRTSCTWTAQGAIGGGLPQSATIELKGWHKTIECSIAAIHGLPVELLWVEVE